MSLDIRKRMVIELDADCREGVPLDHPQRYKVYLRQREDGTFYAVAGNGTPMCLSNFAENGTALGLALENALTSDEALAAVREHCYSRYSHHARVVRAGLHPSVERVTACCVDGMHDNCSTRVVTNPDAGWHHAQYAPCECACHASDRPELSRANGPTSPTEHGRRA